MANRIERGEIGQSSFEQGRDDFVKCGRPRAICCRQQMCSRNRVCRSPRFAFQKRAKRGSLFNAPGRMQGERCPAQRIVACRRQTDAKPQQIPQNRGNRAVPPCGQRSQRRLGSALEGVVAGSSEQSFVARNPS